MIDDSFLGLAPWQTRPMRSSTERIPLVSVIVPCYNIIDYVDLCVRSLCEQDWADLQIVLVDDGSSDGTGEALDAWSVVDDRISVVHQVNKGLGAARNAGIDVATGGYLSFVDGDDVLPATALDRMVRVAEASSSDIVSGVAERFDDERRWRASLYGADFDNDVVGTHLFERPQLVSDQMACSKLFRRDFWDRNELRFPEGTLFEDASLVVRAHCSASSVDLVSTPTYSWRLRATSITSDRFREGSIEQRFGVALQVDAYLRDQAPDRVWLAHGEKIYHHELRLYGQLADAAGQESFARFVRSASPLVDSLHPDAAMSSNRVTKLLGHYIGREDVVGARTCARLLSNGGRRSISRLLRAVAMPWPDRPAVGLRTLAAGVRSL